MVDASEVAFVATFLVSEKAWAVSGELVVASGGAGRSVYYWERNGAEVCVSAGPRGYYRLTHLYERCRAFGERCLDLDHLQI
jgi:hypothetical protein